MVQALPVGWRQRPSPSAEAARARPQNPALLDLSSLLVGLSSFSLGLSSLASRPQQPPSSWRGTGRETEKEAAEVSERGSVEWILFSFTFFWQINIFFISPTFAWAVFLVMFVGGSQKNSTLEACKYK